jgi:hypothetical protein
MTNPPVDDIETGFVNCVVHSLTGAQVLYYLLHIWSREPRRSVILWCATGEAVAKSNSLRVALSKERKAKDLPRTFELKFSEPWPYTYLGIKGEAIKVEKLGGSIATRMRSAMLAMNRKAAGP